MEDSNPELESFRQQWRAEVSAKAQAERRKAVPAATKNIPSSSRPGPPRENSSFKDGPAGGDSAADIEGTEGNEQEFGGKPGSREPQSALEYYESAVETENRGNLTDSLNLYRKAFRMDDRVDQLYKNKHFPPSFFAKKPHLAAVPTAQPNSTTETSSAVVLPTTDLILSFSKLAIPTALPEIEGQPPPFSPFSVLPAEILTSILMQLAILDLPSFVKLSLVCKKLAYLVATEEPIWKRIALGKEVGFGGMFYEWQREITGEEISSDTYGLDSLQIQDGGDLPSTDDHNETTGNGKSTQVQPLLTQKMITDQLLAHIYLSYHNLLRLRPRIRFNGVYISTVTYHRPGQASVDQITWNSPVHTVTYYRYLRFFRDGTCISLLTSAAPIEVVSMINRENVEKHAGKVEESGRDRRTLNIEGDISSIKSIMRHAKKGRWHLSSIISPEYGVPSPESSAIPQGLPLAKEMENAEGDCLIETEGVGPKYIFRMELSLKDARMKERARRNNRLNWKGYWLYNKITDDWAEFPGRDGKSFTFSRVKSYED